MSDLLDAWDKIASVVSAFIGIASLLLSIRQFRRVKAAVRPSIPWQDGDPTTTREEPVTRPLEQALIPLSATLLLATVLLIYSDAAGSHGWRLVGLVLMSAIVVLGMVAEAITDHRLVPARPESVPKTPKRSISRAATMLPLVLVGYLFVNIPEDGFGLLVTRSLPVLATGLFAAAVILTRGEGRRAASARRTIRPLGAFLLGLIIGAIALLIQRGPAAGWSTSENVDGAYAEGTITRTTDGELEISGDVFDNVADYRGTRLYVDARQAGGSVTHRSFHNGEGEGTSEPIDGNTGFGVARYTVPGDTESIDVLICSAQSDKDKEVIFDVQCAAAPTRIWPR